jgi:hypothetical protein
VYQRQGDGCVGLYFGRSAVDTGKMVLHFTCEWTFVEASSNEVPTRLRVNLRFCEAKAILTGAAKGPHACDEYEDRSPRNWHPLGLEVTPRELRVFWHGGRLTKKDKPPLRPWDAEQYFDKWRVARAFQQIGFTPDLPAPPFAARSGLGFFVENCTASFRNVKIEPLAGDN